MAAVFLLIMFGYVSQAIAAPMELQCYDCPDVKHPGDCHTLRRCPHHEYCAADVFEDPPGELKWRFHCKGHHECPAYSLVSMIGRKRGHHHELHPGGHVVCEECCTTDSCNKNLCQNALANVHHAAPICYDCNAVKHPNDCNRTRQCAHGEICATEISGVTLAEQSWTFFCKKQHECPVTSHVGRKRAHVPPGPDPHPDPHQHQSLACQQCCQSDYCNKLLCQPVTTAPSTTASTTMSTAATTSAPLIYTATHATLPVSPVNVGVTTHASPLTCVDIPLPAVNCGELAGRGLCVPVPGSVYELMKLHCRKTCNFC